ncbi:type III secretion system gatekeeper subunit SctW [Burkholderia dolosa]|uniref:Type III secretion system gatekeeper subunit SctW n=1 Tax=Burkholderia dolosa TaxID=152500 RepID=A0A892IET6_9BURK|nr:MULTISPECIES: type III secretion system gatekeeper subunit SctW [Burkholderia]AJY10495.1 type III secretion regulator YopN/LcrE/InvE/MxiC [Burkholderia dolosa AU0158]AYZ94366.1 YopN family type III secretion system gatekeeper subunit [Burkholderia dolosa]EAY71538.1 Invasion protein [Burkholderia dolosa AU0158]ETP63595.1 type III secretion system protein InvE [Burkholderia dolosa PC543]MBR8415774.1 type III secretion system gatekeeper subunit SctW [Burkholderia dolosa]
MASINGTSFGSHVGSIQTRMLTEARHKDARQAASERSPTPDIDELENPDDLSPAALHQRVADLASHMGSIMTQFHRRRDFERKRSGESDGLDRVLDEEVEPKAEKLFQIVTTQRPSAIGLFQQAMKLFPDESDLYAVLKQLLKRKQLTRAQRSLLQSVLEEVEQRANPKALKGGFNCALKARLFGKRLQIRPALLRLTYRNFLECDGAVLDQYEAWIGTYGHEHRHAVMRFVGESLSTDIHASDPSCSVVEFGYLIGHVKKLQRLQAADEQFVAALLSRALLAGAGAPAQHDVGEEELWLLMLCSFLRAEHSVGAIVANIVWHRAERLSNRERSILIEALRRAYRALPDDLFVEQRDADEVKNEFDRMMDVAYQDELRMIRSEK